MTPVFLFSDVGYDRAAPQAGPFSPCNRSAMAARIVIQPANYSLNAHAGIVPRLVRSPMRRRPIWLIDFLDDKQRRAGRMNLNGSASLPWCETMRGEMIDLLLWGEARLLSYKPSVW